MRKTSLVIISAITFFVLNSSSLVFAGSWNIQTVQPGGSLGWTVYGKGNSIAIDSLGRPHISYLYQDNLYSKYYLNYAFWDGTSWNLETIMEVGNMNPGSTSLVLDSNDMPHICFTRCYIGQYPFVGYMYRKGSNWMVYYIDRGASGSIAIDSSGKAHFSYSYPYDEYIDYDGDGFYDIVIPHSDLKYAYTDGISLLQTQTVEYGGRIGEQSSLALDSQMRPRIAYQDFGVLSRKLKYAAWNESSWQIQVVDDQGNSMDISIDPSLALSSSGTPCISYHGANYSLKYATFPDGAWQTETVESHVGHNSLPNSLTLDKIDRPHISYQNNGLSILKYAARNNTGWSTEVVDETNSPGLYNSIAVDSNNQPHISYFELFNGGLKYATINVEILPGDVDNNRQLDLKDIILALKISTGINQ